MTSYRELKIFQISRDLAVEVHKMSLSLPKFELYEEGAQVRRSSKSVTSNIVEGYGRKRYKADYIRYLICSLAECDETIVHLEFLLDTGSAVDKEETEKLLAEYNVLSKRINKYIQWVERDM